MLRYEDIFDFYSEEPLTILSREKREAPFVSHEQIFRVRRWLSKDISYSWSLYSQTRDLHPTNNCPLILRKVVWHVSEEKAFLKQHIKEAREALLHGYPKITSTTIYLQQEEAAAIINALLAVDACLATGIVLEENEHPSWCWRDMEVLRVRDWGKCHLLWSRTKQHVGLEQVVSQLEEQLAVASDLTQQQIYEMKLNYSVHPEIFFKTFISSDYS